ncbi:hypothetical protein M0R36_11245 [bacterium]|jgi:hypothetical protein|nr:hypothetical protein [bacterium]
MIKLFFIVIILFNSLLFAGEKYEDKKVEKGIGFHINPNGGISIIFTNDDFPFNPSPFNPQPQPSPNPYPDPSYDKDLRYIMTKYNVYGRIVPMIMNGQVIGSALVTGNRQTLDYVFRVVRIEEVDGMRVQIPINQGGYTVPNCNVFATQLGNVYREKEE